MNKGYYFKELNPDAVVGGCINIFENAWSEPEKTIETVEKIVGEEDNGIYWSRATTIGLNGGGEISDHRSNFDMGLTHFVNLTNNFELADIHNQFYILINRAANSYCNRYGINEPFWHEPYNVLKYRKGQEYKPHYDGCTAGHRHISVICYLNNDYVGGEIEFPNFDIRINPEPGMMLVFPSNFAYTHIAKPVIEGTKYAMVTWLHDYPIEQ